MKCSTSHKAQAMLVHLLDSLAQHQYLRPPSKHEHHAFRPYLVQPVFIEQNRQYKLIHGAQNIVHRDIKFKQ